MLAGHMNPLTDITFSPDGTMVATASWIAPLALEGETGGILACSRAIRKQSRECVSSATRRS